MGGISSGPHSLNTGQVKLLGFEMLVSHVQRTAVKHLHNNDKIYFETG